MSRRAWVFKTSFVVEHQDRATLIPIIEKEILSGTTNVNNHVR